MTLPGDLLSAWRQRPHGCDHEKELLELRDVLTTLSRQPACPHPAPAQSLSPQPPPVLISPLCQPVGPSPMRSSCPSPAASTALTEAWLCLCAVPLPSPRLLCYSQRPAGKTVSLQEMREQAMRGSRGPYLAPTQRWHIQLPCLQVTWEGDLK